MDVWTSFDGFCTHGMINSQNNLKPAKEVCCWMMISGVCIECQFFKTSASCSHISSVSHNHLELARHCEQSNPVCAQWQLKSLFPSWHLLFCSDCFSFGHWHETTDFVNAFCHWQRMLEHWTSRPMHHEQHIKACALPMHGQIHNWKNCQTLAFIGKDGIVLTHLAATTLLDFQLQNNVMTLFFVFFKSCGRWGIKRTQVAKTLSNSKHHLNQQMCSLWHNLFTKTSSLSKNVHSCKFAQQALLIIMTWLGFATWVQLMLVKNMLHMHIIMQKWIFSCQCCRVKSIFNLRHWCWTWQSWAHTW